MADYDLRPLQVIVVDKEGNTRRLLRGILARLGLDKVTDYADTTDVTAAMTATPPDLLFIDADAPETDGLRFTQMLRHSQAPMNPFLCIIAMTWQPTQSLLMRFTASGADDLMAKPFSAKQVHDRLINLIDSRKSFVVTADYIGPDRRRQPREGVQIPLFNVPNTMRQKAMGLYDRNKSADAITDALEAINVQKVVRCGFQVAFLVDFAAPGATNGGDRMALEHLVRAGTVLEDMMRRLKQDSDLRHQADKYAQTLRAGLEAMRAHPPEHPVGDIQAMHKAAMGLAALTSRRTDIAAVETEVRGAVSTYRSRLAEIAQAKANGQAAGGQPADKPATE